MSLTLQNLSDRIEIEALLIGYCDAIDNKTIDDFDALFTEDAIIDFSNFGGPKGNVESVKEFLKKNQGDLPKQHMLGNINIKIDVDFASSRCICFNPQAFPLSDGGYQMGFFGLWYEDTFIRTNAGWRIKHRVSKPCYDFNLPT